MTPRGLCINDEKTMDATTIAVGTAVRDSLAEYRDEHDHPNMNDAIKALLSEAREERPQKASM